MFDNIYPQIQLLLVAHAAQPYSLSTIQLFSLVFILSIVTKEGYLNAIAKQKDKPQLWVQRYINLEFGFGSTGI